MAQPEQNSQGDDAVGTGLGGEGLTVAPEHLGRTGGNLCSVCLDKEPAGLCLQVLCRSQRDPRATPHHTSGPQGPGLEGGHAHHTPPAPDGPLSVLRGCGAPGARR